MDTQTYNSIVSFIWGIADECLRDIYEPTKYRDVILPMTVIRRFDALLEPTKQSVLEMKEKLDAVGMVNPWDALNKASGQTFSNTSPFVLRDLLNRSKKQSLQGDFEAYLDGFSPNVQEILDRFKFRSQIETMVENNILERVIEKFVSPDINLSPNPIYADPEKKIVKLPGLDNHGIGTIFEELIRKFNEQNNVAAGQFWTPRDVVELMCSLVFDPVKDKIQDSTYKCYDGACGTGGMLTIADDKLNEIASEKGKNVSVHLFGQDINSEVYAICKSDMLLKDAGNQAENISYGSTISDDKNAGVKFDFMLSNPPFGKNWSMDAEIMGGKKNILDTRFNAYLDDGEKLAMLPDESDGQLLFLLNNVSKMNKETELGSRIAEVHNGSSIFTGGAGSGSSNARRYMIENDLVEAVIALPENMFYNTEIGTYIWILSNKKDDKRKGRIQLIDATKMKNPLRKNMGKKNCEITEEIRNEIMRLYINMEENELSKVFNNEEFGYWSITVQSPLRLRVCPEREIPDTIPITKKETLEYVREAVAAAAKAAPLDDWNEFAKATGLTKTRLKAIRPYITEKDAGAKQVEGEADPDLKDSENIPFTYKGGIDAFMRKEVLTYAPDAYINPEDTKVGYEISFTKYFYKPKELRPVKEIIKCLKELESESAGLTEEILEGVE